MQEAAQSHTEQLDQQLRQAEKQLKDLRTQLKAAQQAKVNNILPRVGPHQLLSILLYIILHPRPVVHSCAVQEEVVDELAEAREELAALHSLPPPPTREVVLVETARRVQAEDDMRHLREQQMMDAEQITALLRRNLALEENLVAVTQEAADLQTSALCVFFLLKGVGVVARRLLVVASF